MKQILTMGSLFDGSGGFPLAGAVNGIVPIWASEIEPYPIAVTRSRFPHMRHLGNVIEIDGGKIPPVDVITFGSPCQDMSVAGKRAGMKHTKKGAEEITRSGLFYEAIRIIREMRKVTNGKYPTFAVWENVPGAFSSNKGEDFRCVLQEITEVIREDVTVPRPDGGKWNHAGEIVGDGFNFAWRVLDAQYWGVPQRRKRIYLVADFGGRRAAEILFKQDSVRGNFASSGAEREGASRNASGSADGSKQKLTAAAFCAGAAPSAGSIGYREEQSPTLKSANAGLSMHAVVYPDVARSLCARADSSPCVDRGQNVVCVDCRNHREQYVSGTLQAKCNGDQSLNYINPVVYAVQGNCIDRADTAECNGCGWREKATHTLNTIDRHAVSYIIGNGQTNQISMQDVCNTLDCGNDQKAVLYVGRNRKYIVRRLTPLECCRLQGFPDGWGRPDEKKTMTPQEVCFWTKVRNTHAKANGKTGNQYSEKQIVAWYNKLHTDSREYKMWGNGVALPCAEFVMEGIAEELRLAKNCANLDSEKSSGR